MFKRIFKYAILIFATGAFQIGLARAVNSCKTDSTTELSVIKKRLYQFYLKSNLGQDVHESIDVLMNSLQPDGSWSDYDYKEKPKLGLKSWGHVHRLVKMTMAYRDPSSSYFGFQIREKHQFLDGIDPNTNLSCSLP